jgi:hypothetical protein
MTMDSGPAQPFALTDLGRPDPRSRPPRVLVGVLSVIAHLLVFTALFWVQPKTSSEPEPAVVTASLLHLPRPDPILPPAPAIKPTPAKAGGRHSAVRPIRAPRDAVITLTPAAKPKPDTSDLLSDAQIAGASSAGEDGGGGACDMARAVQRALRQDPLVKAALSDAHRTGRAVMVWNGDWVRSGEQDGKGLAAVREAIMWQIAFAPEACRRQQVHGLILLSLGDGQTRVAVGSGDWRWSDLLTPSLVVRDR